MTEVIDPAKMIAKKKRIIMEVAGQIHDVVEETLWQDYVQLPELSEKLIALIEDLKAFQKSQEA